jgi:hypothetical protein
VTVRVLLFGHYKDLLTAGGAIVLDDLPEGSTVTDVAERLAARDARLANLLQRTAWRWAATSPRRKPKSATATKWPFCRR